MSAEWALFWTDRKAWVLAGFDGLLDEWVDIDDRERALSIEPGTPILVDPQGRIDPRLALFFRRSRFARHADTTRKSYTTDYRLFFTFLWQRGKNWDEADHEDLEDLEAWRRRSADNPARIGGSKWSLEAAAFKTFYEWAAGSGHVTRHPGRAWNVTWHE